MNNENKKPRTSPSGWQMINSVPALLAVALLFAAGPASAQWEITPIIKLGAEADDNATIDPRTDQEVELEGWLAEVSADLTYESERTNFSFLPTYLSRNYSDNPEFENDDIFVRSVLNHRMRASSVGIRVNYDQQQVRTAERTDVDLDTEDPDEIDPNDTGRLLTGDRQKLRFVPYWNWNFSNRSSIGAQLDYFDVTYDDIVPGTLTDYTDTRLSLNYRYAFSDRTAFVAWASGRQYEADNPNIEDVTGASAQIGLERALSPTTRIRARVGVENTEQAAGSREPEMIGDLTFTQNLETITMFAQYRRAVTASGAGQVSARDSISINFSRSLNEKITAGIGVRAYKTRDIGDVVSLFNEREYVQLRSQFIWFLNESFSVEANYAYTMIDRGALLDGRANSNRINLWLVYRGNQGNRN